MIYCCKEHTELALDIIVDEYETAPIIEKLEVEKKSCEYCQNEAEYKVAHE
ncbi:CxxH/CxxC protein [Bacillus aerolatus]|uniref:CxxH/CxxC protein n=1 Tax=Bacillus aerolatus TaxID=2653354 RepID=A0A6I1FSI6_9BACI|nr:CxxH/CxxC protein [Bacillus aerolatus]KAB7707600.1 CxxH/CxxC protein [Bacillus aerolatus]